MAALGKKFESCQASLDERMVEDRRARAMEDLLRPQNPVARVLAPSPPLSRSKGEDPEGRLVIDV